MANILEDYSSNDDLKRVETEYNMHFERGDNIEYMIEPQFQYCYYLVRSKYPADILRGIRLLEDLYKCHPLGRRDYVYNLAIGYAKMKKYGLALNYCRNFLSIEEDNEKVLTLKRIIRQKMIRESCIGIAIAAGCIIVAASVVSGLFYLRK